VRRGVESPLQLVFPLRRNALTLHVSEQDLRSLLELSPLGSQRSQRGAGQRARRMSPATSPARRCQRTAQIGRAVSQPENQPVLVGSSQMKRSVGGFWTESCAEKVVAGVVCVTEREYAGG